jgi:hypothetical protein
MVLKCNITLAYSAPGTPTENPGQESFFGRLKDENRDGFKEMETFEELKKTDRQKDQLLQQRTTSHQHRTEVTKKIYIKFY